MGFTITETLFKVLKTIRPYALVNINLAYRLPSGFAVKSTYRGLKKAWVGFRIAYREGDQEKMNYYAEGIQKFERQLGRSTVSSLCLFILKAVQQQPGQTKRVNNQFDVV